MLRAYSVEKLGSSRAPYAGRKIDFSDRPRIDDLTCGKPAPFEKLFVWLHEAFNGNLFKAPCAFETGDGPPPKLKPAHLAVLARFRHGHEDMTTGQLRFWGYDFRYMSIGLISAVYDQFLKEEVAKKSADGAFYTPMSPCATCMGEGNAVRKGPGHVPMWKMEEALGGECPDVPGGQDVVRNGACWARAKNEA